jgi:hypothetical protein
VVVALHAEAGVSDDLHHTDPPCQACEAARALPAPADRIRARIAEKREEYAEYLAHARLRLREEDLHGLWDCGANASEVSNYIDGLEFALRALEEKGIP